MITDKDPLPIYGFILAGCLIFVILLNFIMGQYLAGWRRPTMGRATARHRRRDRAHWSDTTLHGDDEGDGDTIGACASTETGARNRQHIHGGLSQSGIRSPDQRHDDDRGDAFNGQVNPKFIFNDDPDGVDMGDKADAASASSCYSDDVEGSKSRYAVLRDWAL